MPEVIGQSYLHLVESVERKSRAYFVAMCISKVGCIFVGETERHLLVWKNDYRRICALCHKVGEIDPRLLSPAHHHTLGV